jgi:DNA-binding transcriptional LysR family regulator
MELRRLEHFLTVFECGSFGRASRQLGLTQSGLTKSIQALEEDIGVALFIRHTRGVEPTSYGRSFAQHAKLIGVQVVHALDDISALKSGQAGSLSIGISPTWVMENVLPGVISSLHADHPDLRLTIYRRVSSKELLESLRAGELDIIVGTEQVAIEQNDIESAYLTDDVHGVIARKGHPVLQHKSISFKELDPYGWIIREKGTFYRQHLEVLYLEHGYYFPQPQIETDSIRFALTTVAATDFLSVARQADLMALGNLDITMLESQFRWERRVSIMRRREAPLSDAGQNFIRKLAAEF